GDVHGRGGEGWRRLLRAGQTRGRGGATSRREAGRRQRGRKLAKGQRPADRQVRPGQWWRLRSGQAPGCTRGGPATQLRPGRTNAGAAGGGKHSTATALGTVRPGATPRGRALAGTERPPGPTAGS